jgi:hypothetical protein
MAEPTAARTRMLDVIICFHTDETPVIHMFLGSTLQRVSLTKVRDFWIFTAGSLTPDVSSLQFHISPPCGPTEFVVLSFTPDQPFLFYNANSGPDLLSFNEFRLSFISAMASKTLAFQFDKASSPIAGIRSFLVSFDDSYFMWGLIFVSCQP